MNDIKNAFFQTVKSPGYTFVVVLTLAAGIATNTYIFGIINAFFLRELNLQDSDRIAMVTQRSPFFELPHGVSFPDFKDFRERSENLDDLIAYLPSPAHISARGHVPQRGWVEIVTPNAFAAYNVRASLGRTLVEADQEEANGAKVIFLGHAFWRSNFASDPFIVGKTIILNGKQYIVCGVGEEDFYGFSFSMTMAGWVPSSAIPDFYENDYLLTGRNSGAWQVLGKIPKTSSLEEARAEIAVINKQIADLYPDSHRDIESLVIPERQARPHPSFSDFIPVLTALFSGMVILVMIIACANVANLMLARAANREKEFTMRAALGATRWRLIRQLLTESVALALLAGIAGWILSYAIVFLTDGISQQGDFPIRSEYDSNWADVAFTIFISLVAGLASGIFPALSASRIDIMDKLKQAGSARVAQSKHFLRSFLVVSQIMFSFVVLIGGGLFLKSLKNAQHVSTGFNADNLLEVSFNLELQGYDDETGVAFYDRLLERATAIPGATNAAISSHLPFSYNMRTYTISPELPQPLLDDNELLSRNATIDTGFLSTMGIRLIRGRGFEETDTKETKPVAIVNEKLAQLFWPGEEAIGKRFRRWEGDPLIEVVGITETGKYAMISESPSPFFYLPMKQYFSSPATLVLKSEGNPLLLAANTRRVIEDLDPHLPTYDLNTVRNKMDSSAFAFMPLRLGAFLAAIQGAIGLLLTIMGLYSVISYNVYRRRKEIGIRVAMGADENMIIRLMGREGARLTIIGLSIGLSLSIAFSIGVSRFLFGLSPVDPAVFLTVTFVLVSTAALASYWPARHATYISPLEALQSE